MVVDLPPGVFKMLMDLWSVLRSTFVGIYDFMFTETVSFLGTDYSLISTMLGAGVTVYIVVALIKWVL